MGTGGAHPLMKVGVLLNLHVELIVRQSQSWRRPNALGFRFSKVGGDTPHGSDRLFVSVH